MNLEELSIEDAIKVIGIIRPNDTAYVIRNDRDYLIFRTDTYMVEEILFHKRSMYADTNRVIEIYHQKENINFDLIYLAYCKLIELGYELKTIGENIKRYNLNG